MEGLSAQVEIDVRCCIATRCRRDLESSIRRRDRRRIIREWALHRQDVVFGTDRADPEYLHELQRRYEMMSGGRQFPVETLLKERGSNKYYIGSSSPPPLPPRRND